MFFFSWPAARAVLAVQKGCNVSIIIPSSSFISHHRMESPIFLFSFFPNNFILLPNPTNRTNLGGSFSLSFGWSLGKWGKNTKPWTWKGEGSSVNAVPRLTLFLFFPSLHRVALPNCGSGCDSLSPSLEKKLKTKRVEPNSNRTLLGKSDPDLS